MTPISEEPLRRNDFSIILDPKNENAGILRNGDSTNNLIDAYMDQEEEDEVEDQIVDTENIQKGTTLTSLKRQDSSVSATNAGQENVNAISDSESTKITLPVKRISNPPSPSKPKSMFNVLMKGLASM